MDKDERFARFHRRWVYIQSALFLTVFLLVTPLFPLTPVAGAFFLAGWGAAAMGSLFFRGVLMESRRRPLRSPVGTVHLITALRSMGAVFVLVLVGIHGGRGGSPEALGVGPFLLAPPAGWALFLLLALVETSDLIDGRLARHLARRGPDARSAGIPSSFGAVWDMENDSFFALALSFAAWQIVGIPLVVLAIGAMRYFYFLLVRAEGDPVGEHPGYKLFAKSTTATLMIALIVIYVPLLPHALRGAFVYGALGMQAISFSWDLVLRAKTAGSEGRQVRADR